jgi:hypothetical protein
VSGGLPAGAVHPAPDPSGSRPAQHIQAALWWPAADPGKLRLAAAAWQGLAVEVEAVSRSASTTMLTVALQNQGPAVDSLEAYWTSRWMGGGGALPVAEDGARAMADGLSRYADAVERARLLVQELIAALATAMVIGVGLTVLTVGISDVAAGAVAAGLVAAAAAVGAELSAEVAAILAGVALVAAAGALEGGLSDLAVQGERIAIFHEQSSLDWTEVAGCTAMGAAVGGLTFGAGAVLAAAAPAAGRVAARLSATDASVVDSRISSADSAVHGVSGMRASASHRLSEADIERIKSEFQQVGGDPGNLRFNEAEQTGFSDVSGRIYVSGDVLPSADPNAIHPRSTMSSRAALAHELGHAHFRGTALPPGAWNDEFRASYWAARNVPGLSPEERIDLINDALMRAREANVPIRSNKYMLEMLYGFK